MATVDDRVVSASFENSRFLSAVTQTISALDKLKASLQFNGATAGLTEFENKTTGIFGRLRNVLRFPGASAGLSEVQNQANRMSFGPLGAAVDGVGQKFGALKIAAGVALGNIATKAATAGAQMVKGLTISPVTSGLKEYETNLNSVQTILANTSASGAKLKDVNRALEELNRYSDKTIYNFAEMAKNIGTFTAAGVDLKTATASIKGIANLAATSGSNSQQASTAMYQLSQAISAGRVSLQDWNSVVNAGMGGTVFQRALATTAENMGTLDKGAVSLTGKMKNVSIEGQSFRESITAKPGEKSWLTSDVLTKTLEQFTGDLTDAELAAQGFSKAQIKAIQDQAQVAVKAATEVKTLSGVLDTARETAGSGWAKTWQIIFGDFGEAKKLFTGLSLAINGFIDSSAESRNKVLADWKELGGRTDLIEAIKNVFLGLKSVVEPIRDAFRNIFPATTGKDLADLTEKFRELTERLKIGPETANNLRRSFEGVFAIFSIGKQLIGGVATALIELAKGAGSGGGGVLEFTGDIGGFFVSIDAWLKQGDRLKNFFKTLGGVLAAPVDVIKAVARAIAGIFDGVDAKDAKGLTDSLSTIEERVRPMAKVVDAAKAAWEGLSGVFERLVGVMRPAVEELVNVFDNFANLLANAIKSQNFDQVFQAINTGLLAGLFLVVKKFLGGGMPEFNLGGKALESLSDSLEVFNKSLVTMQTNVKANTLLQIAAASGILAVSVVALSKVDGDDLAKSMTAIAVGFGQLAGAMALLTAIGGKAGFAKLPFISAGLIGLGVAINILALAVKQMANLSWEQLAKGLGGVAGLLVALALAVGPLSGASVGLVATGAGLIAIGIAMRVLAESVKVFAGMKWEELGKGIVGVAGALVAIGIAVRAMPPSILLIGPGLVALAVGLSTISGVVLVFSKMDWSTMGKGLLGVSAALVAIGLAISLIPPTIAIQAAGLILVGIALTALSGAIALMGGMSIGKLAKGIGAIGAALLVLAVGLTAMIAALPGAIALGVAAAALVLLVPAIGMLGTMSWGTIVKGLAAIAAAMTVISVTGVIAAPALMLLGAALIVVGAGIGLVGGGVYLLAKGLVLLGTDGAKGVAVVIAALTGLVAVLPKVIIDFVKGLVGIVKAIADIAPQVATAIAKVLETLLDVIIKTAPKMGEAMTALLQAGLKVFRDNIPTIIKTGVETLRALLKGIEDNIVWVTNSMSTILTRFLTTLTSRLPEIVRAGAQALSSLLRGIADNIRDVVSTAGDIVASFVRGIGDGLNKIVNAGVDVLKRFLAAVGSNVRSVVSEGADLIINLIQGIGSKTASVAKEGVDTAVALINAISRESIRLGREGADAVINFINGVASAIRDKSPELNAAGRNLASAIIGGVLSGIASGGGSVVANLVSMASNALNAVKRKLGIKSPSREFMKVGKFMMLGMVTGIDGNSRQVVTTLEKSADDMIDIMIDAVSKVPSILDGLADMNPVVTPILDLTQVVDGARRLDALIATTPITGATSFAVASSLARDIQDEPAFDDGSSSMVKKEIKFVQNNYSPESLSPIEIYRRTKNQLSTATKALEATT